MMPSIASTMTHCQLTDWITIAVLIGIGLFSLTFLVMGIGVLARYLLQSHGDRRADTT
jgi:hypothetical protein